MTNSTKSAVDEYDGQVGYWCFEVVYEHPYDDRLSYVLSDGMTVHKGNLEDRRKIDSDLFFGTPKDADAELERRLALHNNIYACRLQAWRKLYVGRLQPQE